MSDESCQYRPDAIPLLGRAGIFMQRKIFHLFAQIVDNNSVPLVETEGALNSGPGWYASYLPMTSEGECAPRLHKCERLWRISTAAQTMYRSSNNQELTPLSNNAFEQAETNNVLPAGVGAVFGSNGWFRALVQVNDNSGNRIFRMDLDETVEIYGFEVNVMLIGPPGTVLVTDLNNAQSTTPATFQGTVVDARVGAQIIPIEEPTGMTEVRYTQLFTVPANTTLNITVPRFARFVKIFQDNAGASAGPWLRQAGSTTVPYNVGTINFTNRRSDDEDMELGRESNLITDSEIVSRRFQVEWTIRP